MKICLPLAMLAGLAMASTAHADRFYFGSAETEDQMAEGTADYVDGVLMSNEDGVLLIRVEGGTITVPESSVYKIERDMLTVKTIQARERNRVEDQAEANARRRELLAEEAEMQREMYTRAYPPARELVIVVDFQGLLPSYVFSVFDPVLQRANLSGLRWVIEDYLRAELAQAAHRAVR